MISPLKRFFEFDSFRVDVTDRQVRRDGNPVPLTPKVFDILLVLLENKGEVVNKEELIRKVWADTFVEEGNLNRNISTLRKALGDDLHDQKFVKTLPKRGYQFTANVKEITEETTKNAVKPALPGNRIKIAIAAGAILILALAWTMSKPNKPNIDLSGLTENERRQLEKRGSANSQANADYVKGRALWHQRSAEGLHQSILHLESAVRNDENFALAHAALADAYAFDIEKQKIAEEQANGAIRLDPGLGEPHATLGFIRMFWEWKILEATSSFKRAVELSPDYATAHQWYAINLVATAMAGAALAEMKRALELEPKSLAINADMCQIYYLTGKHDEAIAQCRKTLELDPNFLNAHVYLYEAYTAKGMYDDAVNKFFEIERLKSEFALPPDHQENLRQAYKTGGIRSFWQTRVEFLEKQPRYYELAKYYARLNEKEKALSCLKRSHDTRDFRLDFEFVFFMAEPAFFDLRNEPIFKELTKSFEKDSKP